MGELVVLVLLPPSSMGQGGYQRVAYQVPAWLMSSLPTYVAQYRGMLPAGTVILTRESTGLWREW